MSRPFKNNMARSTFATVKPTSDASEYIRNKRSKFMFCSPNTCSLKKNMYSQSNLLTLRRANRLAFYPCLDEFNKTQLYSNLYTRLDLTGVQNVTTGTPATPVVIIQQFGQTGAAQIISPPTNPPYLTYNIDPSGVLFGDSRCGINNYLNYVVFNPPPRTNIVNNQINNNINLNQNKTQPIVDPGGIISI